MRKLSVCEVIAPGSNSSCEVASGIASPTTFKSQKSRESSCVSRKDSRMALRSDEAEDLVCHENIEESDYANLVDQS